MVFMVSPLERDNSFSELLNHVDTAPLESHHFATVSIPDDHLIFEVVLARNLGWLVEFAR